MSIPCPCQRITGYHARRHQQHANTLSFVVEVKKSRDYFDRRDKKNHIRGDFPKNYVNGLSFVLTTISCSNNESLCNHFKSFADIPIQVIFLI